MKRNYNTDDTEPESNFKLPPEAEYLFQVTDVTSLLLPDGTEDANIQRATLEIIGGEFEGTTILNRCNLDQEEKAFYFTRLFLKAMGEPYKGQFDTDTDRWIGRQFYATIKHTKSKDGTKTYANINEYNFDKKVEQQYKPPVGEIKNPNGVKTPEEIQWEN